MLGPPTLQAGLCDYMRGPMQLASVIAGGCVIAAAACPLPRVRTRPGVYLTIALAATLVDFFGRFGKTAVLILALICVYRLSDFVLNIMTPFYLDLGFSKTEVAEARKVFGVAMSMVGVFAGGLSVARLGVMRSMVIGAFALPITNTIFAWLATQGPDMRSLMIAIGIDNVVSGFAGTCLIAYMSSLTSAGFTATQYALLSSAVAWTGKTLKGFSGVIVEQLQHGRTLLEAYAVFYLFAAAIGLPAIALCVILTARGPSRTTD